MNRRVFAAFTLFVLAGCSFFAPKAPGAGDLLVGLAVRDVTPGEPILLSGYASRDRPSERVDHALVVQAMALKDASGERLVLVSLDNCEVSAAFTAPVLARVEERFGLPEGALWIVSSHTHSGPVLSDVLPAMFALEGAEGDKVRRYSERLRAELVEVVGAALADLKPARLERGSGRAGFARNRRVYREGGIQFGENPEGPTDTEVPVLKVSAPGGELRAIVFGYACHGTSIAGEEFYVVSGDYMAYAREHLERDFPGAMAIYLTGCGADSNPSPRGRLHHARQHGLELAGAVAGVLNRPMRPVRGALRRAYARIELPLAGPPSPAQLEADAKDRSPYVRRRAELYLEAIAQGKPIPAALDYPIAAARIGSDLTFIALAGEVVVDYSLRLKRELALDSPWLIGYAMEVPCYIPSLRVLREGGYEADSSLIYYGLYGPFKPSVEELVCGKVHELVSRLR
jgi:neutral ceramidase